MICPNPNCKHNNPKGAKFCEACGTPLPASDNGKTQLIGWLSVISGSMVLLGFLLPWFTISFFGIGGQFSGLTGLFAAIGALIAAAAGTGAGLNSYNQGGAILGAGGGIAVLILIVFIVFICLSPIMGFNILRMGLQLVKNPELENTLQKKSTQTILRLAIIGGIPLVCYFSFSAMQVASFNFLGLIQFNSLASGFWMTLIGFIISIISGAVL